MNPVSDPELTPRPASKALTIAGLILTALWIAAIVAYALVNWPAIIELTPNEVADFAAGAFAPLAFLWLVLGFFQQGRELRNSGQALWLQGRELQHSVEQQRQLVEVTREQLQFENEVLKAQREEIARNSQPILALEHGGSISGGQHKRLFKFHLVNRGRPCTDLSADFSANVVSSTRRDLLGTGGRWEFMIELPTSKPAQFETVVTYLDERFIRGTKRFQISGDNSGFEISEML
jgi:hypothetical protein